MLLCDPARTKAAAGGVRRHVSKRIKETKISHEKLAADLRQACCTERRNIPRYYSEALAAPEWLWAAEMVAMQLGSVPPEHWPLPITLSAD